MCHAASANDPFFSCALHVRGERNYFVAVIVDLVHLEGLLRNGAKMHASWTSQIAVYLRSLCCRS